MTPPEPDPSSTEPGNREPGSADEGDAEAVDTAPAVPDAGEIWAYIDYFRKLRRRRAFGRYAYAVYVIVLAVAAYGATPVIRGAQELAASDASQEVAALRDAAPVIGPVLFALLILSILRGATWHGPVSMSAADAEWLLAMPMDMTGVLRSRGRRAMAVAAVLGAIGGLVIAAALGLAVVRNADRIAPLLGTGTGAGAALGAGAVAAGVLVQRWPRFGRAVVSAGGPVIAVAVVICVSARWSGVGGQIASWSGPWGWATVLLDDAAGVRTAPALLAWPLLVASALALVISADRQAGSVSFGTLRAQAAGAAGLRGALFAGETRDAVLQIRATRGVRTRQWRVPAPHRPPLLVAWRDLVSLLRAPGRPGGAAVLAGLAIAALAGPGRQPGVPHGIATVAAALAWYLAALVLAEPARVDADDPQRSAALPFPFAVTARRHVVVPVAILAGYGLLGSPALIYLGKIAPFPALAGVCSAAVIAVSATLTGAFRGRVPIYILFSGGDYGALPLALWFLGPLVLGAGLITAGILTRIDPATAVATAVLVSTALLSWAGARARSLARA